MLLLMENALSYGEGGGEEIKKEPHIERSQEGSQLESVEERCDDLSRGQDDDSDQVMDNAARLIQRIFKLWKVYGVWQRKRGRCSKEEGKEEVDGAVTKIQALFRGYYARKEITILLSPNSTIHEEEDFSIEESEMVKYDTCLWEATQCSDDNGDKTIDSEKLGSVQGESSKVAEYDICLWEATQCSDDNGDKTTDSEKLDSVQGESKVESCIDADTTSSTITHIEMALLPRVQETEKSSKGYRMQNWKRPIRACVDVIVIIAIDN
eukprot:6598377-Ditylum_brightwellii.AAC.1